MGRLILFITIFTTFFTFNASAAEKELPTQHESIRLTTLYKELDREKNSLAKFKEELIFLTTIGDTPKEQLEKLEENISAAEENITFLEAEITSAKGGRPRAAKNKIRPEKKEDQEKPKSNWWDVYSRDKHIQ